MKVRRAEPKDAEIITKINVETWQSAYRGLIDDSILDARKVDEKRIATWLKIIQDPSFIVLVCEDEDVVGYLSAGSARDDYGIENEIYALYVKPSEQGKGVGSALIKKYKQTINNKSFYLYMLKNNRKAATFYAKNGGIVCEKYARNLTVQNQTIPETCYVFEK